MRTLVLSCAAAALACLTGEAAAQGAWCTESMNSRNCGFYTLEQCRAAASGDGAYCDQNPFVTRAATTEPRKPARPPKPSR